MDIGYDSMYTLTHQHNKHSLETAAVRWGHPDFADSMIMTLTLLCNRTTLNTTTHWISTGTIEPLHSPAIASSVCPRCVFVYFRDSIPFKGGGEYIRLMVQRVGCVQSCRQYQIISCQVFLSSSKVLSLAACMPTSLPKYLSIDSEN